MGDLTTMPEPAPGSQVPTPVTVKPKDNIALYATIVLTVVLSVIAYTYINKYHRTQTTLDETSTTLTTTQSQLKQTTEAYSDYKKITESNTSWSKTPYVYKGKLITTPKGDVVYLTTYTKNSSSTSSGSASMATTLTQAITVTQAVTIIVHEKKDDQSGVPIQGSAYLSLPIEVFTGKISRLGIGLEHAFLFDTAVGFEVGTNDITNVFGARYVNIHVGHGIP